MSPYRLSVLLLATSLSGLTALPSYAGYAMPAPENIQTRESNWYLNGFVGAAYLAKIKDKQNDLVYKFKTKYDYGMAVGYRVSDFRFEAQYTSVNNRYKSVTKKSTGTPVTPASLFATTLPTGVANPLSDICKNTACSQEIKPTLQALMANVYYDFQGATDTIGFYAGLGVGYARFNAEYDVYNKSNVSVTAIQRENKFAFQGLLGVSFNPDGPFSYDLGYRYLTTGKLSHLINGRPVYHLLNLGITYTVPVAA